MTDKRRVLAVPAAKPEVFAQNVVRLVTCELRFPVLLGHDAEPPRDLYKKLRRSYPHYERNLNVTLHPGREGTTEETRFFFRSKKRRWTVTFRSTAIAMETNEYTDFDEFREKLEPVVEAAIGVIDSDFFTRVGLRYVNILPVDQQDVDGWVNEDLAPALTSGVWGDVDHAFQEVRGITERGKYTLRHGYPQIDSGYVLDLDMYREDVEVDELGGVLDSLRAGSFELFSWCIGPKAREYMSGSEGHHADAD